MFTSAHQLTQQQLNDLEQLKQRCKVTDQSTPNVYAHILAQSRLLPACNLYYKNKELLGFISVFFFYEDAVEISLLVDPQNRKHGLAKKLISSVLPLITNYEFVKLVFSSPHQINTKWLKALGFTYTHSEYFMQRKNVNPILEYNKNLHFRPASKKDIDTLCALDEACFHKKTVESQQRYQNLLDNHEYTIFLAEKDQKIIGKAHIRWENKGASLSDIAILPALQGRGYGTALIAHCINHALSEGKTNISLDVETHNEKALRLYTQLDFQINNACDYWSIPLKTLQNNVLNTEPKKS